jgi:hypothetical protein
MYWLISIYTECTCDKRCIHAVENSEKKHTTYVQENKLPKHEKTGRLTTRKPEPISNTYNSQTS